MSKPILIIGAGVGGLALAQGLSKHSIPFEVYDRDVSINARAQGYRFRISDDGLRALDQNLTTDLFKVFKKSCCSNVSISNARPAVLDPKTAAPVNIPQFGGRSRPEAASVDRTALRSVLMDGIEQHVHFGKAFESYCETDGGITVRFTDDSEVAGLALIGTDGTWSRVRQQLLPEHRLVDTEGRLIFGKTEISDDFLAKFTPDCAKGPSLLLGHDRKYLMEPMYFNKQAQHAPADYVSWALFARSDDEIMDDDPTTLSAKGTFALAQRMTKDWHPSLRCLIDSANQEQVALFRILSAHPSVHMQDNTDSRITLLGDAIHPMSPTGCKF